MPSASSSNASGRTSSGPASSTTGKADARSGLAVVELLRASHIKPWADCATDAERLDVYNGILLAPQLDAAFDRGLMTFADDGTVVVSGLLGPGERRLLGIDGLLRSRGLELGHRSYLEWHREKVFRPGGGGPP